MAGHYPVFSAGDHGDIAELKQYLLPLLVKYNVDAYLCGHDHISEHLHYGRTEYYVAGAGAMTDSLGDPSASAGSLLWSGTGYSAFAVVTASLSSLTVSYVDTSSTVRYSHTQHRNGSVSKGTNGLAIHHVPGPSAVLLSLVALGAVAVLLFVASSLRLRNYSKRQPPKMMTTSTPQLAQAVQMNRRPAHHRRGSSAYSSLTLSSWSGRHSRDSSLSEWDSPDTVGAATPNTPEASVAFMERKLLLLLTHSTHSSPRTSLSFISSPPPLTTSERRKSDWEADYSDFGEGYCSSPISSPSPQGMQFQHLLQQRLVRARFAQYSVPRGEVEENMIDEEVASHWKQQPALAAKRQRWKNRRDTNGY